MCCTVAKEGVWQTILRHGEGRPEDPQQGGRRGDGMPVWYLISILLWKISVITSNIFFTCPQGAAGLPPVSLAACPCGLRCVVYRGLPPLAALLDARMVRQVHLHPYHSPWCQSGVAALHGRKQVDFYWSWICVVCLISIQFVKLLFDQLLAL